MWQCGIYTLATFFQCLESVFSIHPSRRQRVMMLRKADSPQKPRFIALRSSIVNTGDKWSNTE